MPWIAAVVGAGASLWSGMNASKAQQQAMQEQENAQRADLGFRQEVYQDQKHFAQPIADELKDQALQAGPLDYGPMKDQIAQQVGLAGRSLETQMAQRGLTGSGLDAGATRGMMLRQAGDLSKAYQQGLINKRGLALTLLGHDQRMQAAGQVGQGYQNLAGAYAGYAGLYGSAAQGSFGSASNALMNGLYLSSLQDRQSPGQSNPGSESALSTTTRTMPEPLGSIPASRESSPLLGLTPQTIPPTNGSEWGAGSDWKSEW